MGTDYSMDVSRYTQNINDRAIAGIVKHLGVALRSADASFVSCSSSSELTRVRESWLRKKLGLQGSDADLDNAIKEVCEKMKADKTKSRVTFYYLLAERFGKLPALSA